MIIENNQIQTLLWNAQENENCRNELGETILDPNCGKNMEQHNEKHSLRIQENY